MIIKSFKTKPGQQIPLSKFTVLVGANNTGKSQTLRDLSLFITQGPSGRLIILDEVDVDLPSEPGKFLSGLDLRDDPDSTDRRIARGVTSNLVQGETVHYTTNELKSNLSNPPNGLAWVLGHFGRFKVALLDAGTRLQIASATPPNDPASQAPQNLLQLLYKDSSAEERLQDAFRDTFRMELRLDYSSLSYLRLRVANDMPPIPKDPREAFPIMASLPSLDEQGDGFKSFTGVLLSLLLAGQRVLLIDEPEAFLHPAQARRLGHWVAEFAAIRTAQVIVATHNSHFLSGILASNHPVDIYRLNREGDCTSHGLIGAQTISDLSRSPLLSSQRVLESVFQLGVVVCEGDSDRLIYQTVAAGQLHEHEVQFVHAHNKQTIKNVVALLRGAQIPCAAVADIDLLRSGKDLAGLVRSFGQKDVASDIVMCQQRLADALSKAPEGSTFRNLKQKLVSLVSEFATSSLTLEDTRSTLKTLLRNSSGQWDELKRKGIGHLEEPLQGDVNRMIESLASLGIFLVPVGELESWINVGTGRKNQWIVSALEQISKEGAPEGLEGFVAQVIGNVRKKQSLADPTA